MGKVPLAKMRGVVYDKGIYHVLLRLAGRPPLPGPGGDLWKGRVPVKKSIKRSVAIRVAATLVATILLSVMTTVNIFRIQATQAEAKQASSLLNRAQSAEAAHYRWSANLSNALYAGKEFTGSIDPTTCVLGQWLYGEAGTNDQDVLALRSKLEPLHKELHESATAVLDTLKTDPAAAQAYYQETILSNLNTLVGLLDQVIERGSALSADTSTKMDNTAVTMHITSGVCLAVALACLLNLIFFVLNRVVRPILTITSSSSQLQEGRLDLRIAYKSENELGDLARTLTDSMALINSYVEDINRILDQVSQGEFDVDTSADYIGDFQSIQQSIRSFTSTLSAALGEITQAEQRISQNADQLASSSQSLAQGATEQASSVEELYATLDDISKSARQNVTLAGEAQDRATRTGEQVSANGEQMKQMVAAMSDISNTSQQIGQVLSTIENIAFQTNILALNAAVEAARAGDAGKGFAVVAGEVRNLAAQSDQAAKATKDLIDNCVQAAERGSHIVGEVSSSLQETLSLVSQSNHDIGVIADAVRGEAEAIQQVTEGIGQISAVVQTNSASSEESAAVSAELFAQSNRLKAETGRFHLKD